jgi:Sec-independent protein translocase protein TatA
MTFELNWMEAGVIAGLILLAFGPERLLEFWDDLRTWGRDIRAVFRRRA